MMLSMCDKDNNAIGNGDDNGDGEDGDDDDGDDDGQWM